MSLLSYFNEFDRPFWMFDRDFFHDDPFFGHSQFRVPRDFSSHFLKPREHLFRPMDDIAITMNRLGMNEMDTKITADDEKFQVNVDVQHFAPEEINVKVVDGCVVIEGQHDEKEDDHGYVSRQFLRRYTLPEGCLSDTVESKLSSDGVLTITAPKVLPLPSIGEKIVPITHTGPVKKQIGTDNAGSK